MVERLEIISEGYTIKSKFLTTTIFFNHKIQSTKNIPDSYLTVFSAYKKKQSRITQKIDWYEFMITSNYVCFKVHSWSLSICTNFIIVSFLFLGAFSPQCNQKFISKIFHQKKEKKNTIHKITTIDVVHITLFFVDWKHVYNMLLQCRS